MLPLRVGQSVAMITQEWSFPLLQQLIHNGIIIPEPPAPVGLTIAVRGEPLQLTPKQEEMAMAWAKKKDTPYVEDPVFVANFMRDFRAALGVEPELGLGEVDLTPCFWIVDAEREAKAQMTREERKALAAQRKARRESLKARYGYAIVNGQRVELGTYMTEPSGIFMGRGQHPLRGRWKEGAVQSDVTLNVSPDAPAVEGDWAEIVWQPQSLWVARWKDKLSGKLKYVWLSDTAPIKQEREARKFDRAIALDAQLAAVRARIGEGLVDPSPRQRMIATACYLIDALCLRVGDEKDPDEADTVGATTLRPEHVSLNDDGTVAFRFLGKDSVEWHKVLEPLAVVRQNLAELIEHARPANSAQVSDKVSPTRDKPQLFPDIASRDVNAYLSDIQPGLTAKVFRTHHATAAVRESLAQAAVLPDAPEHVKWMVASLANLEAAVLCNHTKKPSPTWPRTRERYRERRARAEARVARCREQVPEYTARLESLRAESRKRVAAAKTPEHRKKTRQRYRRRIAIAERRVEGARGRRERARIALERVKARYMVAREKRAWNLNTTLKSYIDPRVFYEWGQQVDYDVLGRYYPATLRRKFAWVWFIDSNDGTDNPTGANVSVRTCLWDDLAMVAHLFEAVRASCPTANLPVGPRETSERYLPSLEREWREAIILLDEQEQVIGFAAIGPEWCDADHQEETALDVLALLSPQRCSPALARCLADEVHRRVQAHQALHPQKRLVLRPRNLGWRACAEQVYVALGLDPDQGENQEET